MSSASILTIDIGTTNVKCVVFSRELQSLGECACEYETNIQGGGRVEQNPADWWRCGIEAIRGAIAAADASAQEMDIVLVSSQAPTMLPVDKNGVPLHPALIWMDTRSVTQCEEISNKVGAGRVEQLTGNRVDPFYVAGELLWFRQTHPALFERTHQVLQANGYFNYLLTGEFSLDEVHASITQCYNVHTDTWNKEILDACGVSSELFPRVSQCHQVIGRVTQWAAQQTGLRIGTAVAAGTVDGAAAGLEGGVSRGGMAAEMSGTSSVLIIGSEQIRTNPNLTYMKSAIHGQHLLLGCMSTTGGALKWFRNQLYTASAQAYSSMNAEVEEHAPDPSRVIFLPYMAGERAPIWNPQAKGAFLNLTLDVKRADMIRAIMEGAAFALKDNILEAARSGVQIQQLRVVGGHTNSDIWLRIKASVLNLPLEVPACNLGAPGGLACMGGYALGEYASVNEAVSRFVRIEHICEPVPAWHNAYEEKFLCFKESYDRLHRRTENLKVEMDELK